MCLPDFYAFLCDVLGVISLTILVKILGFFAVNISICDKQIKRAKVMASKCEDSQLALRA